MRTLLFSLLVMSLLCALPAFAAEPQGQPGVVPAAVSACAPSLSVTGLLAPATPVERADVPAWLEVRSSVKFHGYCHCGCSAIPDCNTSADCGGAPCGRGISCC
jgi:hypothetical protein